MVPYVFHGSVAFVGLIVLTSAGLWRDESNSKVYSIYEEPSYEAPVPPDYPQVDITVYPDSQDGSGNARPNYKRVKGPKLRSGKFGYNLAQHQTPWLEYETDRNYKSSVFFPGNPCQDGRTCTPADVPYRSVDGSCNNMEHSSFGQAGLPYRRLLPKKRSLVDCGKHTNLPNPRYISQELIERGEFDRNSKVSMMTMAWGQVIDHDIEITPVRETAPGEFLDCCQPQNLDNPDCCPITTPMNDKFYGHEGRPRCMPFLRSKLAKPANEHCDQQPDAENSNTAFVDASFVYGSDQERVKSVRSFKDGLLRTSVDTRGRFFPPITVEGQVKMEFGDTRGDVHPAFTMLSTVFLRNHNRLANELKMIHPHWDDEKVYQEARKINIAVVQHITYTDFLDALLGQNTVRSNPTALHEDRYDPNVDATISMVFSSSAYRLHTYIAGAFILRNKRYDVSNVMRLRDVFHNPLHLLANNTYDDIMRGLCTQSLQDFNNVYSHEMTEWLFPEKDENFGLDIVSLNIQRGRDHQIPGYASYREFCGLGDSNSWDKLSDFIAPHLVQKLAMVYKQPEEVDLYVGGNMEKPKMDSLLGPTMHCLVKDQFERLRTGDRFFYTNPGQFTTEQLKTIKTQTLARVLCDNADEQHDLFLPRNMFLIPQAQTNRGYNCMDHAHHPPLNLHAWR